MLSILFSRLLFVLDNCYLIFIYYILLAGKESALHRVCIMGIFVGIVVLVIIVAVVIAAVTGAIGGVIGGEVDDEE